MPTSPVTHNVIDAITRQDALDPPAKAIGKQVRSLVGHGPVKDVLSGTPIGHALHPLLTDVPIGTWMSSVILDMVGGEEAEGAADKLLAAGLAATLPTVWSGWNDWADTEVASDGVRRVGIVHAAVNGTAAGLFAASYSARRSGRRGRGKLLSLAGISLLGAGGWLGGHLSYAQGVGVDNTVFEPESTDWTPTIPEADLAEGAPRCVKAGDVPVLLVRQDGRVHALANRCTHRGGPLHEGELGHGTITCPWHGSTFSLEDGSIERGPAAYPQPTYDVRVTAGTVEVRRVAR
jgi:nitrite reductase/ring-hydroxylating ferredoxin subunit/uncharacterized membrane protein